MTGPSSRCLSSSGGGVSTAEQWMPTGMAMSKLGGRRQQPLLVRLLCLPLMFAQQVIWEAGGKHRAVWSDRRGGPA